MINYLITSLLFVLMAVLFAVTPLNAAEIGQPADEADKQIVLAWDAPVERVDGTELTPEEIAGYRLYKQDAEAQFVLVEELGSEPEQYSETDLASGVYCYKISTVDSDGLESYLSESACVVVPARPGTITLTIELI